MEHKIKFYPVNNADCTLIKLSNGKTIIIDCQFLADLNDDNGKQVMYDVKADLLKELKKDSNGRPFVDLFINTHPHKDHCLGFGDHFYIGSVDEYDDNKDENKIIIGELWVTPIIMGNDECEDAEDIRKEAKRRRKLYKDDETYTGEYGDYLRIIGYDKDKEFDNRYSYIPGTTVSSANGGKLEWLDMFIHAPFKEDIEDSKKSKDKNLASIVIQYSFKIQGYANPKCKVLIGGDAEHDVWQHILDNNEKEENLKWNIFLAPHHCSWTFFNDTDKKDNVLPSADEIISQQIGEESYIIASSKEIKEEDDDPPCEQAKKEYIERLKNSDNFRNTAVDHVVNSIPQPIVFYIDEYGKRKDEKNETSAGSGILKRPAPRAGK